jgi:hypothetical protein
MEGLFELSLSKQIQLADGKRHSFELNSHKTAYQI